MTVLEFLQHLLELFAFTSLFRILLGKNFWSRSWLTHSDSFENWINIFPLHNVYEWIVKKGNLCSLPLAYSRDFLAFLSRSLTERLVVRGGVEKFVDGRGVRVVSENVYDTALCSHRSDWLVVAMVKICRRVTRSLSQFPFSLSLDIADARNNKKFDTHESSFKKRLWIFFRKDTRDKKYFTQHNFLSIISCLISACIHKVEKFSLRNIFEILPQIFLVKCVSACDCDYAQQRGVEKSILIFYVFTRSLLERRVFFLFWRASGYSM